MAQAAIEASLKTWLKKLNDELTKRKLRVDKLDRYHDADHPPPDHVRRIRLETEYRVLMKQAITNWPELIVGSVTQRLEVTGFRFGDGPDDAPSDADKAVWEVWQDNALDARSKLLHEAALTNAHAYAIVWTDENGDPLITPEHASTTIVAYANDGHTRTAALKRWVDDNRWYCTLYLPDGIYKFQGPENGGTSSVPSVDGWDVRQPANEDWPLANPLKVVPVVEFAVNQSLKPGIFCNAHGEFERVIPIIDRINTTIFAGLLAQAYASFPVRALIGVEPEMVQKTDELGALVTDDSDEPVMEAKSPIDNLSVDRLIVAEDPNAKLVSLPESDLKNYIAYAEMSIRQLGAITQTPVHYLLGEMVNLSADAIRAAEAGLISKIGDHHVYIGEAWEEVMRLAMLAANPDDPQAQESGAEIQWKDAQNRSLAEQADAAIKLTDVLPREAVWRKVLNATPQEIAQWKAAAADDSLSAMINQAAAAPATTGSAAAPGINPPPPAPTPPAPAPAKPSLGGGGGRSTRTPAGRGTREP